MDELRTLLRAALTGARPSPGGLPRVMERADRRARWRGVAAASVAIVLFAASLGFLWLAFGRTGTLPGSDGSGGNKTTGRETPAPAVSTTIPSSGVSVAVFNGTSTPGLATTAMRRLQDAGYVVGDNPHVAPRPVRRTAIYYRKGVRSEADRVATLLFGGARVLPMPTDVESVSGSEIVVFLGRDYQP